MKKFIISMFMLFTLLLISSVSYAQPVPPPPGYHYERVCYTSLIPFPHSECSYRLIKHYRPAPPPPRPYHNYYRPAPPPPHHGQRPGHHPPPPRHHR